DGLRLGRCAGPNQRERKRSIAVLHSKRNLLQRSGYGDPTRCCPARLRRRTADADEKTAISFGPRKIRKGRDAQSIMAFKKENRIHVRSEQEWKKFIADIIP